MKKTSPPLTLIDYQRIFQVAHGVIREVGKDTAKSCLFFGLVGAYVMKKHYGYDARPVLGAAYYKIHSAMPALAIADPAQDFYGSSSNGFHCWVETEDWYVDFSAPLFPEMMRDSGFLKSCERWMFQKHRLQMADHYSTLANPGDFYLEGDAGLTDELVSENARKNDVCDLIEIAAHWYKRPPRKIERVMAIQNDLGEVMRLTLNAPEITGVW